MAGKLKARPALATNLSSSRVSTKDGSLARLPFSLRRLCAVALSSMVAYTLGFDDPHRPRVK